MSKAKTILGLINLLGKDVNKEEETSTPEETTGGETPATPEEPNSGDTPAAPADNEVTP